MKTIHDKDIQKTVVEFKTVKDVIEFAVNTAVKRFDGSSLHVESIINELNPYLKTSQLDSLVKINITDYNNEQDKKKFNKLGLEKKKAEPNQVLKKMLPIEKERFLKYLKELSPEKKDEEIKKIYPYKEPSSLNQLEHTVLNLVSEIHNIGMITLLSKYRGVEAVYARNQYITVMSNLFGYNTVSCGRLLARDHSTVIHARRNHNDIMDLKTDKAYIKNFELLLLAIKREFPEIFEICEDKVEEVNREYRQAVRNNTKRKHKILKEITIADLLLKKITENGTESTEESTEDSTEENS